MQKNRMTGLFRPVLFGLVSAAIFMASLVALPSAAQAKDSQVRAGKVSCEDLAMLDLPATLSVTSELIAGGEFQPPGLSEPLTDLPDFCRVSVVVDPAINIEVWLPTYSWNRRFKGVGGGGYAGVISWSALGGALRDGYATASTDTGHISTNPGDGAFAFNPDGSLKWDLIEDFASRALFEMTTKAKTVTRKFYGKKPDYSYWMGCSTGGRQGLMQVQRTPDAYDGVLAGAPAVNWDRFIAAELWPQVVMQQEAGGPVNACKFEFANNAALEACDAFDGVVDGVLEDPRQCQFDPTTLPRCPEGAEADCDCLTEGEASAILAIWDGVSSSTGDLLWPGLERTTSHSVLAGGNPFPIATDHLKWTKEDSNFDWQTLGYAGFDQYFNESQQRFNAVIGTDDPDLSQFKRGGNKLIMWHGWTDQFIYPQGTTDYYDRVVDQMGGLKKTQKFARLFMAPGVNHCDSGEGPNAFGQQADNRPQSLPLEESPQYDMFEALVHWVEKNQAPEQVIATKYVNDDPEQGIVRTRPLCAYPKVAVYNGSGDTDDAANFSCSDLD